MIYDDIINDYLSLTEGMVGGVLNNDPIEFIIHHTGGTDKDPLADSSNQTFEIVDNYHKEKWNGLTKSSLGHYIGYHLFIDINGKQTLGRDVNDIGAHTIGRNNKSFAICLAGNFDRTMPTTAQIRSLKLAMAFYANKYHIPRVAYPHRHYAIKTCYGKNLSDTWAQDLFEETSVNVSPPTQDVTVSIPAPVKVVTEKNDPAKPTFNLFAYIWNLCKKLSKR